MHKKIQNVSLTLHHIKVSNVGFGLLHTHTAHPGQRKVQTRLQIDPPPPQNKTSILNTLGRPEIELRS